MTELENLPGVGKGTAEKLREAGIFSVMGVATVTPGQLVDAIGGTTVSARKIIASARELCSLGFEVGSQVAKQQEETEYIPTHCANIDELLGGGLKLGTTMEVFGEFSSGKTTLSHLLAVSTIHKFPDSYVIWVDSENTFSSKRIKEFSEGLGISGDHVLEHILVGKSISSDHQILLTETVEREIVSNGRDVKLLIIDSLMNHFRAEYLGRGTLANRQQVINGYLHKIGGLVASYNMAVYMTNQIQSDPSSLFGDPNKAIGGNIVSHFATTRLYVRRAAKGTRKIKLIDSPDLPEGEALFIIETHKLISADK
jgi:DNA repair protein RadA